MEKRFLAVMLAAFFVGSLFAVVTAQDGAALIAAVKAGNADKVKQPLDKGADVGAKDEDGATPLHLAASVDLREFDGIRRGPALDGVRRHNVERNPESLKKFISPWRGGNQSEADGNEAIQRRWPAEERCRCRERDG